MIIYGFLFSYKNSYLGYLNLINIEIKTKNIPKRGIKPFVGSELPKPMPIKIAPIINKSS